MLAMRSYLPAKARRAAGHPRLPTARRLAVCASSTRTVELDSGAFVVAPTRRRPRGVVHFLGGAFVAAAPTLAYPLLLERLADGGFTCVATPYAVTFKHLDCARAVHAAFLAALQELRSGGRSGGAAGGLGAWTAPSDVPTHGVGHSNGALLHLLIGSQVLPDVHGAHAAQVSASSTSSQPSRASNVLISYNNRPVGQAVPVPLGALQPVVQQVRGQGRLADAAQQSLRQAAAVARQLLDLSAAGGAASMPQQRQWQQQQRELLDSLQRLDPAVVQLGSVFDEVGDGYQEFSPSPAEARQVISSGYCVPSTLLLQFTNDSIDETPEAEAMLSSISQSSGKVQPGMSANGAGQAARQVRRLVLPGTHVTPCGGDPGRSLPPGASFGPAEALATAARALVQADTQRLADRVLEHLAAHS